MRPGDYGRHGVCMTGDCMGVLGEGGSGRGTRTKALSLTRCHDRPAGRPGEVTPPHGL